MHTKTYPASWLQPQDTKSCRHNHSLLLVVWWWNAFKHLESVQGLHTPFGFVWDHATDCVKEDATRCTEVVRPSSRVDIAPQFQVLQILH